MGCFLSILHGGQPFHLFPGYAIEKAPCHVIAYFKSSVNANNVKSNICESMCGTKNHAITSCGLYHVQEKSNISHVELEYMKTKLDMNPEALMFQI